MFTIEKTQPSKVFRLVLVPIEHISHIPEVASPLNKNRLLLTTCVAEYATREDIATLTAEGRISPTIPPSPQWHAWHQTQMAIDDHRKLDESRSDTVRRLARERDTAKAEVKALKAALERQQSEAKLHIEGLESLGFLAKYEEPWRSRKAFCSYCKSNVVPLEDWGTLASHTRRIPGTLSNEACPGSRKPSILSDSWENGV